MTEAGKKDPAGAKANAELAARTLREREANTQTSALQKRLDELEQKLTQKDQQAQFESKRTAYIEHAAKQITDETPIAKALGDKNPEKLRAALWATTERLIEENDGEVPDPADVLATYEKTRRAELEELGVDPTTLATPKKNTQAADKKHPAKTLGNDLSTPRVPRPARSDREHRAETLEMLESGRLE
jgi:vancomycin resistance protein YoaR